MRIRRVCVYGFIFLQCLVRELYVYIKFYGANKESCVLDADVSDATILYYRSV